MAHMHAGSTYVQGTHPSAGTSWGQTKKNSQTTTYEQAFISSTGSDGKPSGAPTLLVRTSTTLQKKKFWIFFLPCCAAYVFPGTGNPLYTYFNRKRRLHINLQHLEILTLIKEKRKKNYPHCHYK
jgi:hypothetical protein